jgi:hypothetical protein
MPTDDEMSEFEAATDTNNSLFKVQSMFVLVLEYFFNFLS